MSGPLPPVPALVRPTDAALVIGSRGQFRLLRFGVLAAWGDTSGTQKPVINARSETLRDKPLFRGWLEQRVAVPMAGYDEWQGDDKRLHHVGPHDGEGPLLAAALWDGGERFCLLTCAADGAMAEIHHRMPVFLPDAQAADAWLGPYPFAQAQGVLRPHSGMLHAAPAPVPLPAQGRLL
nr:SOS response-associated peptidase family protein [Insolitispirillum peregrinum]